MSVSADNQRIVYVAQDTQHGEDIWIWDAKFHKTQQLTHINPQFDRYVMGTAQLIEWNGSNGEKLRGALLLPADYDKRKRYPLVVYVYGGESWSRYINNFGFGGMGEGLLNMHLLASRGYAVLFADTSLRVGTPLQDLATSLLPGVDKVVELGIAEREQIGLMGGSYGGYSTLALLVQTTRFKAAIMEAGWGNMIGIYGTMSENGSSPHVGMAESGQDRMGGSPWQFRDRYIENSPIFYLDRIKTPLLIIHGTRDGAVPSFLADEVFVGMRRLGKEAVYAKYEGEDHQFFNYRNQIDVWNRRIAWFDKHLKAPEKTEGSKQ